MILWFVIYELPIQIPDLDFKHLQFMLRQILVSIP